MATDKIIYDLGSNNGDDIPYFLLKGDLVVAVEANPVLCEGIRHRFRREIEEGRLVLENCVVSDNDDHDEVDFFVHNTNHVESQFPEPHPSTSSRFTRRRLPAKSIAALVRTHGDPHYVKVDIEHFDAAILRSMFDHGISPTYVSAECHELDVFLILTELYHYKAFKLVDGQSVSEIYADRLVLSERDGTHVRHSFPFHSAGPFGNDIDGDWMTAEAAMTSLAFHGLGWKDIHATNAEEPNPTARPRVVDHLDKLARLDELVPYISRRVARTVVDRVRQRLPRRFQ